MSDRPLRLVIDANVALKLFFEQSGSEQADALFAHLEKDAGARFFVPDFFYAECTSAFAIYSRQAKAKYTPKEARQDMTELLALAFHVMPTTELASDALDIALIYGVSGYDAFYVALSRRLSAPLVTADEKLVRALDGKPFQVRELTDFEIPPLPDN
jgi:predicted nucleic acid-binding protein